MSLFSRGPLTLSCVLAVLTLLTAVGCYSEAVQSAQKEPTEIVTRAHLRQLTRAVMMYAQDNDFVLPPAQDNEALKACIGSFITSPQSPDAREKIDELFRAPLAGKEFAFNTSLAGTTLPVKRDANGSVRIVDPKILFYEPTAAWENQERYVVTIDGVTKRIKEGAWTRIKQENGIP